MGGRQFEISTVAAVARVGIAAVSRVLQAGLCTSRAVANWVTTIVLAARLGMLSAVAMCIQSCK